jgi:hypothetical protein
MVRVEQSGNSNNTGNGDSQITVSAGGARPRLNSLVVIAIDILTPGGTLPDIVLPMADATHPMFNQISCTTVNSPATMEQCIYWKAIGSGETSAAPSFGFGFQVSGEATVFRATGVGINYVGSCTEELPACSNPISDEEEGTSVASNVVTSATPIGVPAGGVAATAFGTSDTTVFFGEAGSPNGTIIPSLSNENNNSGVNAGLAFYDQFEASTGTYGPFSGTLPNNDTGDNVAQSIGIIPNP